MNHLRKWWIAYGGAILAVGHNVWPQMREYICAHPTISGGAFAGIILAALLKGSPLTLPNISNPPETGQQK